MTLRDNQNRTMKCAVIGLGEFGAAVATGLAGEGVEVIAIDNHMDRVNAVKDQVALAVCMDASQDQAMDMHGIADVDVLIAAIGASRSMSRGFASAYSSRRDDGQLVRAFRFASALSDIVL